MGGGGGGVGVGALTVSVNEVVLVIPAEVEEIIIVCVPVGVVESVEMLNVVEHVGEQFAGEKDPVAPDGRPMIEKDAD